MQPDSRKRDWFDVFERSRLERRIKQSSTVLPPSERAPSASMILNNLSKAFSKATNFCISTEVGVR